MILKARGIHLFTSPLSSWTLQLVNMYAEMLYYLLIGLEMQDMRTQSEFFFVENIRVVESILRTIFNLSYNDLKNKNIYKTLQKKGF